MIWRVTLVELELLTLPEHLSSPRLLVGFVIRVITKLPNSEQSNKGKVKTHKYMNRQNQSTTGKLWFKSCVSVIIYIPTQNNYFDELYFSWCFAVSERMSSEFSINIASFLCYLWLDEPYHFLFLHSNANATVDRNMHSGVQEK